MNTIGRDLHTLFDSGAVGILSNGQLLERFLAHRHEADFAILVERLGPMVWGVCRRVLRDHHDAEDAFQATFLVLARKAASILPREKVGHWLYGVAYQTARRARVHRTKRQLRERASTERPDPEAPSQPPHDERLEHLDRELNRLPEKYRIPILLCDLQGQTHQQAAAQLGWPIGTVSGRLSRARSLLARRLNPRGSALPAGSLAGLLALESASAKMPLHLITSTAHAACLMAAGRALSAGLVSAQVTALFSEVLNAMWFSKLKLGALALIAVSLSGAGVSVLMPALGPSAVGQEPEESKKPASARESAETDQERIQGTWILTDLQQVSHQPTDEEKAFLKTGKFTITIKDNQIVYEMDGSGSYFTLDPSQTPKQLTLKTAEGPNKGKTSPAIYKLNGDDLTICQGRMGDTKPPSSFSLDDRDPGTFPTVMILKRKIAPQRPAPAPEVSVRAATQSHQQYLKTRAETARQIFEQESEHVRAGIAAITDEIALWSRRWMEDELQLRNTPAEKIAAIQDHVDRLRHLEKQMEAAVQTGRMLASHPLKMKYFRLEAEHQLSEFHAAHPDVPLPEPKEPEPAPKPRPAVGIPVPN